MSHPLNKHIANAFQDFEGLHIAGTIPLREEMLNELISYVLQNGVPAPPSAPPAAPEAAIPSAVPPVAPEARAKGAKPDVNALLKRVKKAQVRFEDGRAIIDFEVGV